MVLGLIKKLFEDQKEDDDKIVYKKQTGDCDCVQTCLDMLGYDGHEIFPPEKFPGGVMDRHWRSISGAKRLDGVYLFYKPFKEINFPVIVAFTSIPSMQQHAVVVYKDRVYCPSLGVFPIRKYVKMATPLQGEVYEVPLKNPRVSQTPH